MDVIGRIVGKYRIVEQIGKGGMGLVFKGYRPDLNHYAAIKILPTQLAQTPGFEERFTREAQAIAQLNHPNILSIIDFGHEEDGLTYLVTKYVTGRPLSDRMGQPMELPIVMRYLDQIAAALDHAHGKGLIHRDIKPANILIDEGDWVLLADFGLVKILTGATELTGVDIAVGTPAYMSPEQGSGAVADHRADIYSLGVTLYEMLTGQRPFQAETPPALILKHIFEPPTPPGRVNPALPADVDPVILKSLAKAPAERFSSASELARAFSQATAVGAAPSHVRPAPVEVRSLQITQPPTLQPHSLPPYEVIDSRIVKEFVGREKELKYLEEKLRTLHLAIIAGMPGVGKTALALQLAQRTTTLDKTFLHAFHEGEGIDVLIWKLAGFLAWHEQRDLWNMLRTGQQTGGHPPPLEVLFDYALHMLRGQGYLLIFDDFHFVESNPLLNQLIERLRSLLTSGDLTLIIVAQHMPPFARENEYPPLFGLDAAAAQHLLAQRGLSVSAPIAADLFRLTEGNAQMLTLAIDAARSASDLESFVSHLTESRDIERYLMTTIDQRLSGDERAVMNVVASLLGYSGTRDAIEAILEGEGGAAAKSARRTLKDLHNRYLLMESDGEAGKEYGQHEMVRNFYYNMLSKRERQAMHRRAGEFYEMEEPDALKAAQHFDLAREYERAAQLATADVWASINRGQALALRSLLEQLAARLLPPLAVAQVHIARGQVYALLGESAAAQAAYETALNLAEALPDSKDVVALACLGLGELLQFNLPREAQAWLQQGLDRGSATQQAALLIVLGHTQALLGDTDAALGSLQRGLALLSNKPGRLRARALVNLGVVHFERGEREAGMSCYQQALRIHQQLKNLWGMLDIWHNLGYEADVAGQWKEATEYYRKEMDLAEGLNSTVQQCQAGLGLGILEIKQGNYEAAEQHLLQSLTLARQRESPLYVSYILPVLAGLYLRQNRLQLVEPLLSEAEGLVEKSGAREPLPEIYRNRAILSMGQQDAAGALSAIEQSLVVARELKMDVEEGMSRRVQGQAQWLAQQRAEALASFEQSLALLNGRDPYEAARTQLAWGQALLATHREQATTLLQDARATFERLGARRDLAAAEDAWQEA